MGQLRWQQTNPNETPKLKKKSPLYLSNELFNYVNVLKTAPATPDLVKRSCQTNPNPPRASHPGYFTFKCKCDNSGLDQAVPSPGQGAYAGYGCTPEKTKKEIELKSQISQSITDTSNGHFAICSIQTMLSTLYLYFRAPH